ncbi:hypothetical protein [Deinococcus hohokamensis]|uniref:Uncharacterized protein n=1 Tax=Deinococcus hohokamensis TaxID=309883 RepID=A0ABV9I9D9_9DEIO
MSQTSSSRRSGAGRLLLWLALLLSVALLGFVVAVTSRANPLQSDRETNGISKYKFLQQCRELAEDAEKLTVSAMGQSIPLKTLVEQGQPLQAGDELHAELDAGSVALVRAVQPVQAGGWSMTTPTTIGVRRNGALQTLGQLPLSCSYSKKEGKVVAQVQLPNQ